jgi:hypothetical protein
MIRRLGLDFAAAIPRSIVAESSANTAPSTRGKVSGKELAIIEYRLRVQFALSGLLLRSQIRRPVGSSLR